MTDKQIIIDGVKLEDIKNFLFTGQKMAISTKTFEAIIDEIEKLTQECEKLKEYIETNKTTGICETCTHKALQENDRYRQVLKKISLNDTIEVELTNEGYETYMKYIKDFNKILPKQAQQSILPKLNKNDRFQTQLWELIRIFNSSIALGLPTPFKECSIYVEVKDNYEG